MQKKIIWEMFGWGTILWFIGYCLGIIFFFFVPAKLIGWYILPIGTILTILVVRKKIKKHDFLYYIKLGIAWSLLAILYDYFFIVKLLKPSDGYYKLDVIIYYCSSLVLPPIIGWFNKFVDEI